MKISCPYLLFENILKSHATNIISLLFSTKFEHGYRVISFARF